MGYQIIKVEGTTLDKGIVMGEFDSAYTAMTVMRRLSRQHKQPEARFYLLDMRGDVLAGPDDLYDLAG